MTPFERSFSKLSENHKIVDIGSTEFKLWQLKELKESPNRKITYFIIAHAFPPILLLICTYLSNKYVLVELVRGDRSLPSNKLFLLFDDFVEVC